MPKAEQMPVNNLPPETSVPGHRLLVVSDLGPVRKGDHVVMVAGVIVAVDTQRRPEDAWITPTIELPAAQPALPQRRRWRRQQRITQEMVLDVVRRRQEPISAVLIGDALGLDRKDTKARSQLGHVIQAMKLRGVLSIGTTNPKLPKYILAMDQPEPKSFPVRAGDR